MFIFTNIQNRFIRVPGNINNKTAIWSSEKLLHANSNLKNGINKINDFKLIIILNVAMVIMLLFFQIPGISDSGRFTYNVSELGGEGLFFY